MLPSIKKQKKHLTLSMGGELELPLVAVIVFQELCKIITVDKHIYHHQADCTFFAIWTQQ